MWSEIGERISQETGEKFTISQHRSVGGGCINQAYEIREGQRTYFVKLNQATQISMFEAEAAGLQEIYQTATIRVPEPICWGTTSGGQSYLVLEWIELSRGGNLSWEEMGHQLAALHRIVSQTGFGWHRNNTIGATAQINPWESDWAKFFSNHRLSYQLHLAKRRGGNFPQQEELLAAIPQLLSSHQPQPSLVHGDLWSGNAAFSQSQEPVLFDPAVYFGDREVDLAMTELFGGFPKAFYQSYQQAFPLNSGYEQRKTLYNLYHILNHFNLFGGSYASQAQGMIQQVLASV
jgi:fructosamine-3-kinase